MEYGYSILMFCFSGGLLLYALLLYATGDSALIPKNYAAKKDKRYARQVAKIVAATGLAPLMSGYVALYGEKWMLPAVLVLLSGFVICIPFGIRLVRDEEEGDK